MWLNFASARSSSAALATIWQPTRSCSTSSSWTISRTISSTAGITMLIPNVPARSQASFVVVLRQVALDAAPICPLSERVTWREITQDVPFGQDERHHADDGPATGRRPCLSFRRRKVRAPNDFYFFAFFFFDFLKPTLPALGS